MSLTIRDAESSFLAAQATVSEWQAEFIQTWVQPEVDLALIMFWQRMDPVMKRYLQDTQPAAYQEVEQQVKQAKERYANGPSE